MNFGKFTGPGSTPSRRKFWDSVADAVTASQKQAGRYVTVDEHHGRGTIINSGRGGGGAGACCIDGECSIITAAACEDGGGNYLGNGSTCDDVDCTQGACCDAGECSITTEEECSGNYLGDGTDCDPNPCITALCCGFQCSSSVGKYRTRVITTYQHEHCVGSDAHSESVTTQNYNEDCSELTTECSGLLYRHAEGSSPCDCVINSDCSVTCDPEGCSAGFFGCCPGSYDINDYDTETSCGETAFLIGTDCTAEVNTDTTLSNPAGCLGACCHPNGDCFQQTEADCADDPGLTEFHGIGSSCDDFDCGGACCDCFGCNFYNSTLCDNVGGAWYEGIECDDACPLGRCCLYNEDGILSSCAGTPESQCNTGCCDPPCPGFTAIWTEGFLGCSGEDDCPSTP